MPAAYHAISIIRRPPPAARRPLPFLVSRGLIREDHFEGYPSNVATLIFMVDDAVERTTAAFSVTSIVITFHVVILILFSVDLYHLSATC